jgi:hypothetical protein
VLLAAAAVLAGYLALELWDVFHYSWTRSYDAAASDRYVQAVAHHHLPAPHESDVWHNPPLFYAVAALVEKLGRLVGVEPHRAVQLVSVACGLAIAVLALATARLLFPRSAWIQLGTLGFAVATPVLLRGSLLYHPEPLATALSAGGIYVAARSAEKWGTAAAGALAGLLLGLSDLTRSWALAEAAAVAVLFLASGLFGRKRRALRFAVAFVAVFAALAVPWYATQAVRFGNPLAFSKPNPAQWRQHGRPGRFFYAVEVRKVFSDPYQPTYRNLLLSVVYADWWGDYARYFHMPPALTNAPPRLPAKYRDPLVRQSVVGILPTLLALVGAIALALRALRRRSLALGTVLAAGAAVAASFVAFLVEYPKLDGDNIKALYLLDLVVPAALCAAYALDLIRRRLPRGATGILLAALVAAAVVDVRFFVLG